MIRERDILLCRIDALQTDPESNKQNKRTLDTINYIYSTNSLTTTHMTTLTQLIGVPKTAT